MSLSPLPFPDLLRRMRDELRASDAIFDLPVRKWFVPDPEYDLSAVHFGRKASTPVGPAAGPHTQLAQNIVLSWLGGARIVELKTVQVNDQLHIPRPCIHVPNVGLNVEWSQELRVEQSLQEYAKALYLIEVLKQTRCFGRLESDFGMDTVFDISVGYDLAGIQSAKVTGFLTGMLDPEALWDDLRGQLAGDLAEFKNISLPGRISDCVTLSTFHGCPAGEIESITKYLIAEMGFNAIVKLNPTLLGFERVRELLYDVLGYEEFHLSPDAFAADLQYGDALAILRNLKSVAENHDSMIGAKFTNTLVVANDPAVFPTQTDPYMYVSGPPLHVIAMNLMQRVRNDLDFEFPVSFSAGIDAKNFPGAVACGMVPITTCTDLLRQGGYGRLPAYLSGLKRDMDRLGVKSREAFVLSVGGNAVAAIITALADAGADELGPETSQRLVRLAGAAPDGLPGLVRELAGAGLDGEAVALQASRVAGRLNGNATIPALERNPRYHREKNTREPRTVESVLGRYDCLNCDLCIVVCPNDAFFAYDVNPGNVGVGETHQLALVDEWCNECSNCEVYCPETGAPFVVKERVFATETNFAASGADGFLLEAELLRGRVDGNVFEMSVASGSPVAEGEIPDPVRTRFATVYHHIYRGTAPNPVNPGGSP